MTTRGQHRIVLDVRLRGEQHAIFEQPGSLYAFMRVRSHDDAMPWDIFTESMQTFGERVPKFLLLTPGMNHCKQLQRLF
jgi:hypothetical protein